MLVNQNIDLQRGGDNSDKTEEEYKHLGFKVVTTFNGGNTEDKYEFMLRKDYDFDKKVHLNKHSLERLTNQILSENNEASSNSEDEKLKNVINETIKETTVEPIMVQKIVKRSDDPSKNKIMTAIFFK